MDTQFAKKARSKKKARRLAAKKKVRDFVKPDDWPTEMVSTKRPRRPRK
jgi:hypothetical protein